MDVFKKLINFRSGYTIKLKLFYSLWIAQILPYFTYSMSDNVTPPISRVVIGRHLIFCWLTLPPCCNSPRKCTAAKYKKRQKNWVSNCHINILFKYARVITIVLHYFVNDHVIFQWICVRNKVSRFFFGRFFHYLITKSFY